MTDLRLVPTPSLSDKELVQRLIPRLCSEGSGHMGVSPQDLETLFKRHLGHSVTDTLNEMIREGTVVAALLERQSYGEGYYRRSRLANVEILDAMPSEEPTGKRLRVYLASAVPKPLQQAQKKFEKLRAVLQEVQKSD